MSEKHYRAAKYIRLSHADDKDGESDSVTNQRKILDSYIDSQPDIEVVSEMVDDVKCRGRCAGLHSRQHRISS